MIFCYVCPGCSERWEFESRCQPYCNECGTEMRRDWQAEAANIDLSNCRAVPRSKR